MGKYAATTVAILQTVCNKYNPGKQVFNLQEISGTLEKSNRVEARSIPQGNIINADKSGLGISYVQSASCIKLEVPSWIVKDYPTKYIPQGTRFIVSFEGGDISKPVITGVEYND